MINRLSLYWHTLRYLKTVQIRNRLWRKVYRPRPDTRPAPPMRAATACWSAVMRPASVIDAEKFNLLNVTLHLKDPSDWNNAQWPKLWIYNLHYFDDLNAVGAKSRQKIHRNLIDRWISENPPGRGNGWEPYPTSLRIINWVQWLWAGNQVDEEVIHSLAVQARWLTKNIEYHLLGNHLWANAKALCFAGFFFEGEEGRAWLELGLALITRELREQILPDGGHFERSPMYHSIVLVDILDLIQLARCFPDNFQTALLAKLTAAAQLMRRWLKVMSHPDGNVGFFNDTTFDVAPTPEAIEAYALLLGLPPVELPFNGLTYLANSGFLRLQNDRAVLLADVGAVAPDYIPGHAHAGTLSFEMSLDGERLIVNSGISTYANDAARLYERSTAAHNTVMVAGRDSSQVWSAFRVGRRVHNVTVKPTGSSENSVEAMHDGYRDLGVFHHRNWRLHEHGLTVVDKLDGPTKDAVSYIHWAPSLQSVLVNTNGQRVTEDANWHPGFNRSERIRRDRMEFQDVLVTEFSWGP